MASSSSSEGYALPCGHAYHHACLTQWLHQCHTQGVSPTCPMCQATIRMQVTWRFPLPFLRKRGRDAGEGAAENALLPHHHHHEMLLAGEEELARVRPVRMGRLQVGAGTVCYLGSCNLGGCSAHLLLCRVYPPFSWALQWEPRQACRVSDKIL